jgi:hypothetical protein
VIYVQVTARVCHSCFRVLHEFKRLPKFALANGFCVGELPAEFADTTPAEWALVCTSCECGTCGSEGGGDAKCCVVEPSLHDLYFIL